MEAQQSCTKHDIAVCFLSVTCWYYVNATSCRVVPFYLIIDKEF